MKIERINWAEDFSPDGQVSPLAALLKAEKYIQENRFPLPTPLEYIAQAQKAQKVEGLFGIGHSKLTAKDLLPGLKLRSGPSEIEVVRVLPTTKEVVYRLKNRNQLRRSDTARFIKLANQQGYRKVWNLASFLRTLKNLLKPILAAIPLMWVLKIVINAVRKKPMRFSTLPPKDKL